MPFEGQLGLMQDFRVFRGQLEDLIGALPLQEWLELRSSWSSRE
jgi:hypothetical protein